jgi:hypothetical protein
MNLGFTGFRKYDPGTLGCHQYHIRDYMPCEKASESLAEIQGCSL